MSSENWATSGEVPAGVLARPAEKGVLAGVLAKVLVESGKSSNSTFASTSIPSLPRFSKVASFGCLWAEATALQNLKN